MIVFHENAKIYVKTKPIDYFWFRILNPVIEKRFMFNTFEYHCFKCDSKRVDLNNTFRFFQNFRKASDAGGDGLREQLRQAAG